MKRNTILVAVCFILVLCALAGCQLAKESAGLSEYEDRLVGVFITMEHLDLFDFEGYLNDNLNSSQGGEIDIGGRGMQKYQGRIYAALIPRASTNEETTGETVLTHEYVFEGLKGMQFCVPTIQAAEKENSYIATMSDPAVSDVHTSLFIGDDENSVSLEGTIYVSSSKRDHIYFFNPVYQSSDGSVYLVSGDSHGFSGEGYGESSAFSQTMEASTTVTENGKVKKDAISIKITISVMFEPEKIAVLQMNADNTPISQAEYKTDEFPGTIALEAGAVYFIVETHKRDNMGSLIISRDIFGKDDEHIETFFAREDGVCVKRWTEIAYA